MSTKNGPGHAEKKIAAKSLKKKRAEKRATREAHRVGGNRPIEKSFPHARRPEGITRPARTGR